MLSKKIAKYRKKYIYDINYTFKLYFFDKKEYFLSKNFISFNLHKIKNIYLDCYDNIIVKFIKNNNKLIKFKHYNNLILIKSKYLSYKNNLYYHSINYPTLNTDKGIIKYVSDNDTVYYTNCEPYYANRVYLCFDQPNLKANYKLFIVINNDFIAFSNEKIINSTKYNVSKKIIEFDLIKNLSTYVFCFAFGNFIKSNLSITYDNKNISWYTLNKYIKLLNNISHIFNTCFSKALSLFEKLFSLKYNLTSKFDNIFVPNFASGAMENPGLILYNITYLSDFKYISITTICHTIIHELAHMWFGNLLTLSWWDDIWINESLAEFYANYVFNNINLFNIDIDIIKYKNKIFDLNFFKSHNLKISFNDVSLSPDFFDDITYNKGKKLLLHLTNTINFDIFNSIISNYLKNTINNTSTNIFKTFINHNLLPYFNNILNNKYFSLFSSNINNYSLTLNLFFNNKNVLFFNLHCIIFFDNFKKNIIINLPKKYIIQHNYPYKHDIIFFLNNKSSFIFNFDFNINAILLNTNFLSCGIFSIDPHSLIYLINNYQHLLFFEKKALIFNLFDSLYFSHFNATDILNYFIHILSIEYELNLFYFIIDKINYIFINFIHIDKLKYSNIILNIINNFNNNNYYFIKKKSIFYLKKQKFLNFIFNSFCIHFISNNHSILNLYNKNFHYNTSFRYTLIIKFFINYYYHNNIIIHFDINSKLYTINNLCFNIYYDLYSFFKLILHDISSFYLLSNYKNFFKSFMLSNFYTLRFFLFSINLFKNLTTSNKKYLSRFLRLCFPVNIPNYHQFLHIFKKNINKKYINIFNKLFIHYNISNKIINLIN